MATSNIGELLFMNSGRADVIFLVDGEEIPGHRVVISAVCPHFETFLYGHFKESNSKQVEIKETSPKAFKELIRFIYKGQMNVSDWTIEELLALMALAHRYEFQELFDKVVGLLQDRPLDLDSWTLVNDVASLYESTALKEKCTSFAESKLNDFIRKKDLNKYTEQLICSMFESPNVSACNQDQLLSSLFKWKTGQNAAEITSVLPKICWEKVSTDITSMMIKELFSDLKNANDCQFWMKGVALFKDRKAEEASNCVVIEDNVLRIYKVVLPNDRTVQLSLPKIGGFLSFSFDSGAFPYVYIDHRKDGSSVEFPVKIIQFECPTKFNIKSIHGLTRKSEFLYMSISGPTLNNGWFKYSAAFSNTKQMTSLFVKSNEFENMSQIILRNVVIS